MPVKTVSSLAVLFAFLANSFGPFPQARAEDFRLPAPGVMVRLSPGFNPPILKGIKIHPDDPFQFDFILQKGDSRLGHDKLKDESSKLIKYFLASLTIPEKDLWVNLSPYEKDRIIPQSFGLTEMGRDLLAEDYMLKQITASLVYPEDGIGKKFWQRVYEEAAKRYGNTDIPVNTFNKVWIVPDKAVVYENAAAGTAFIVESRLKVMLEQDYLSLQKHAASGAAAKPQGLLGADIVREIVMPELEKEVNENENFARLRQVYQSFILASWYKKKIKNSILDMVYENKKKIAGVGYKGVWNVRTIYRYYLQAFKKGVYNYIKEDPDPGGGQPVARKYFSGGTRLLDNAQIVHDPKAVFGLAPENYIEITGYLRASEKYVPPTDRSMTTRREFLTGVAVGMFAEALPKITWAQANSEATLKVSALIDKQLPGPGWKDIRDSLVRLFLSDKKEREDALNYLSKIPQHKQAEVAGALVNVIKSENKGMLYPQARKLLMSYDGLPQSMDADIIKAFFKTYDFVVPEEQFDAGRKLLSDWVRKPRVDDVFAVILETGFSQTQNPGKSLARSLTEDVSSLLPGVRRQWAGVVQQQLTSNKIDKNQAFSILRLLFTDNPDNLSKEWFNKDVVGEQEESFFRELINSGLLVSEQRFELNQRVLAQKARELFEKEMNSMRQPGKREDQTWYKVLTGDQEYKSDAYLVIHFLAALVLAQDKMRGSRVPGVNIAYDQMKKLAMQILGNAHVHRGDTSYSNFAFGAGALKGSAEYNYLDFYFVLFHEIFHNFHEIWGVNLGNDLFSSESLTKRESFDFKGKMTLMTITEFLADFMAVFAISKEGRNAKPMADKLRKGDISYTRHEAEKNFKDGLYPLLRHLDLFLFPSKDKEQHISARKFVKELLDQGLSIDQMSDVIDWAYNLIGIEVKVMTASFGNPPMQMTWKDFQHEIRSQIKHSKHRGSSQATDQAMSGSNAGKYGGINLGAGKNPLVIQNGGQGIAFRLNPAQLQQLQNVPGFVPVIVTFRPITSLNRFLGFKAGKSLPAAL